MRQRHEAGTHSDLRCCNRLETNMKQALLFIALHTWQVLLLLTTGYVTIARKRGARCEASSQWHVPRCSLRHSSVQRPQAHDRWKSLSHFCESNHFSPSSSHSQAILASLLSRLPSTAQWLLYLPLSLTGSSKFCAGSVYSIHWIITINMYGIYVTLTANMYCVYVTLSTNIYRVYVNHRKYLLCLCYSHNKYLLCLCDSTNIYRVYVTHSNHLLCLCDPLNKYLLFMWLGKYLLCLCDSHNKYMLC